MKKSKVQIEQVVTWKVVSLRLDERFTLKAKIESDGSVSIEKKYCFQGSEPEVVAAIGQLLVAVAEIATDYKKECGNG